MTATAADVVGTVAVGSAVDMVAGGAVGGTVAVVGLAVAGTATLAASPAILQGIAHRLDPLPKAELACATTAICPVTLPRTAHRAKTEC